MPINREIVDTSWSTWLKRSTVKCLLQKSELLSRLIHWFVERNELKYQLSYKLPGEKPANYTMQIQMRCNTRKPNESNHVIGQPKKSLLPHIDLGNIEFIQIYFDSLPCSHLNTHLKHVWEQSLDIYFDDSRVYNIIQDDGRILTVSQPMFDDGLGWAYAKSDRKDTVTKTYTLSPCDNEQLAVKCPSCGQTSTLTAIYLNRKVRCKNCATQFLVCAIEFAENQVERRILEQFFARFGKYPPMNHTDKHGLLCRFYCAACQEPCKTTLRKNYNTLEVSYSSDAGCAPLKTAKNGCPKCHGMHVAVILSDEAAA